MQKKAIKMWFFRFLKKLVILFYNFLKNEICLKKFDQTCIMYKKQYLL